MRQALGLVGLWAIAGCAASPTVEQAEPARGLARSAEFTLDPAPVAPTVSGSGDGVTLRWGALALSAETLGLGPVVATREAGGALTLARAGGVEERWAAGPVSAEQSWRFAARPAGDRASVTVVLAGATLDHAGDDGLWLRASAGALIRYGHATWVDARGRRTAVPARWVGDRVAIEVPAAVVAEAAYPAVLDPSVTPAFALEATRESTAPLGARFPPNARLVRTSAGSLVFATLLRTEGVTTDAPLMVQRLDASNARVEGSFHAVVPGGAAAYRALVSGDRVLLVWQDGARVLALRLDPRGNALDAAPTVVAADFPMADAACNATRCLLMGTRAGQVLAARFSPEGAPLDAAPVTVGTGVTGLGTRPLVALDDRFVMAWSETPAGSTSEVRLARVAMDGTVLDPGGRPFSAVGANRTAPMLASNGTSFFVAFRAQASGARPAGLYALVFDREVEPAAPVSVVPTTEWNDFASVPFWDGTQWVLASSSRVLRFAPDGARVDLAPRMVPMADSSPPMSEILGSDAGGFFVIRYAPTPAGLETPSNYSLSALRVPSDASSLGSPAALSVEYYPQTLPVAASDGVDFLAAWAPAIGAYNGMRLARLSAAGTPRAATLRVQPTDRFFVSFSAMSLEGTTALLFGDVSNSGAGVLPVDVASGALRPVATFTGNTGRSTTVRGAAERFVFVAGATGGIPTVTFVRRLSPAGVALDPNNIPLPTSYTLGADFDGTRYRVAYAVTAGEVFTRRLDPSGDFTELTPRSLGALGPVYTGLRLAFGAGTHLMTFVDAARQVRAVRLGLDGAPVGTPLALGSVGTSTPPSGGTNTSWDVSSGFNGRNFVVVWSNVDDRRVRAARVSPAGALLDATPFELTEAQTRTNASFYAASDANGSTLVLWDAPAPLQGTVSVRGLFLRDDGAVVPDGGTPPPGDVPPTSDAPVVVTDAPRADAGVDSGASLDASPLLDVPAATDADVVVDAPTADAPTADAPTADAPTADAGGAPDAPVVVADVPRTDVGASTDRGAASDTGAPASDAEVPDAPAVDAGTPPPPDDPGGLCSVPGAMGQRSSGDRRGVAAFALVLVASLRRRGARRRG